MAQFHEVIKKFNKIRIYLQDFLVYGYKKRSQFQKKSGRTYDDEKRRICSYLGEYVKESYEKEGKKIFISMDTSLLDTNPLYRCYETKSFTANDIQLHFYLMDLLQNKEQMDLNELSNEMTDQYEAEIDVQLVSRKLREYGEMGVFLREKKKNKLFYSLAEDIFEEFRIDYGEKEQENLKREKAPESLELKKREQLELFLGFYGMEAPLALVGHYIQNSLHMNNRWFCFENYFIGWTLEDEILLHVTEAIQEKMWMEIKTLENPEGRVSIYHALPFFIMVSVQNGRRYIAAYHRERNQYTALRMDYIDKVRMAEKCPEKEYKERKQTALDIRKHIWGVSWKTMKNRELSKLRFRIDCQPWQQEEIFLNMKAEARRGKVRKIGHNRVEFFIEVYDVMELMPWIRTFLGKICEIECSDENFTRRFFEDFQKMRECYGVGNEKIKNKTESTDKL